MSAESTGLDGWCVLSIAHTAARIFEGINQLDLIGGPRPQAQSCGVHVVQISLIVSCAGETYGKGV